MRAVPSYDNVNSELETLLASSYLMRAPALAKFLSFICRESMEGRGESLKEYTIAVEAFGRPESFHPKEDPIVRVQATRLRRLLHDYYRGEGRHHDVHVTLPAGIDFALTVIAQLWGPTMARMVQLGIEYNPAPPFQAGSPETIPSAELQRLQELMRPGLDRRRAGTLAAVERLESRAQKQ